MYALCTDVIVVVLQFSPSAGPIDGGTNISINGSNLGMRFEDIKSIMIGDAHCDPHRASYIVGRRWVTSYIAT